jgi:hypothetical protein
VIQFLFGGVGSGSLNLEAPFNPSSLVGKTGITSEREQIGVPFADVESDAVMKLPKVYGTQMQWAPIALIQVIRAIHQATIENAVLNSEHMTCFVRQYFAASTQHESSTIGSLDAVKLGIVSSKAKYADAIAQRRLTEDDRLG